MVDFGFSVLKTRQIDYDKTDRKVIKYVEENEPTLRYCMVCGACTATCSVGMFTDFNIRKINILLRWGEIEEIKHEIKKCMLCGKCQLVCPRGVNTRNVILVINKAIEKFENNEI
ncbi:MAG: 4Fe-4S dicluster domain-containing protein [Bacteroidales bacterium]|nr:4Fe-4S dicluster domain-containing protein [Bacteroidales bacterium]